MMELASKQHMQALAVLFVLLSFSASVVARRIYVPYTYPTIQEAAEAAYPGDIIACDEWRYSVTGLASATIREGVGFEIEYRPKRTGEQLLLQGEVLHGSFWGTMDGPVYLDLKITTGDTLKIYCGSFWTPAPVRDSAVRAMEWGDQVEVQVDVWMRGPERELILVDGEVLHRPKPGED